MKVYSAPRNIWRAIYPTLILFGIQILTSVVTGFALGSMYAINSELTGQEAVLEITRVVEDNTTLILIAANVLCLAVFLPMWLKIKKGLMPYELKNAGKLAVTVMLAFMGLNILIELILSLGGVYQYFPSYEVVSQLLGSGHPVLRFIWLVAAAPIVEELCLRGITLPRLLSWTSDWVAVVAQSALFAILHFNLLQGLYAFLLGLALGYLYLRCRRLWLCVAAHAAFNLVGFVQTVVEENGAGFPVWIMLSGVAIFAAATWFFMKLPAASLPLNDTPPDIGTGSGEVIL